MPTKFHEFVAGGNIIPGDIVVGLRGGINTQFNAPSLPNVAWHSITTSQVLAGDNGYFCFNAVPIVLTLPPVIGFGEPIVIVNMNGNQITIAQNAGQNIQLGSQITTGGVGGSLTSNGLGNSVVLVCAVANDLMVNEGAPQGIWVVV